MCLSILNKYLIGVTNCWVWSIVLLGSFTQLPLWSDNVGSLYWPRRPWCKAFFRLRKWADLLRFLIRNYSPFIATKSNYKYCSNCDSFITSMTQKCSRTMEILFTLLTYVCFKHYSSYSFIVSDGSLEKIIQGMRFQRCKNCWVSYEIFMM